MKMMTKFRNVLLYAHQEVDDEVLQDIIEKHLDDLTDFARKMLNI